MVRSSFTGTFFSGNAFGDVTGCFLSGLLAVERLVSSLFGLLTLELSSKEPPLQSRVHWPPSQYLYFAW